MSETDNEFLGITARDCCVDCTAENCVITQAPICGHPMKGGLQPVHQVQPETLARYNRARKALARAAVEQQDFNT